MASVGDLALRQRLHALDLCDRDIHRELAAMQVGGVTRNMLEAFIQRYENKTGSILNTNKKSE